jgi:arsenate reductase (glutaredoxin)
MIYVESPINGATGNSPLVTCYPVVNDWAREKRHIEIRDYRVFMSDTITVYEKPTCTKCREMDRFLRESGVDFSKINYYIDPLSEKKLRQLLKKMGLKPRDLLRTSEAIYRELGLGKKEFSDDEIIALMAKHPDLIQRPIVERGERAVLGRPTENVKVLL